MVMQAVPWAVQGDGVYHSAAVARTATYAATSGAQGVVRPTDLKVTANGSFNVTVAGGAAVIVSTYAGAAGQSYVAQNVANATVEVPAPGGGARTDLVIIRIDDPEYGGQGTGDFARLELVQGVGAKATTAPVSYPHVVLARLNVPAGSGGVTAGMVTDLRTVAVPLEETGLVVSTPRDQMPFGAAGTSYKAVTWTSAKVPDWASEAIVEIAMNGVCIEVTASRMVAGVRVFATRDKDNLRGADMSENGIIIHERSEWVNYNLRQSLYMAGTLDVSKFRGDTVTLGLAGLVTSGGNVKLDYQSAGTIKWTFRGTAL